MRHKEPIAIVGLGCRFPGNANDPATFWRILERGVDTITDVPADRWNVATYYDALSRLVRDSLFDADRIALIAQMNLGGFRKELDRSRESQQDGAQ